MRVKLEKHYGIPMQEEDFVFLESMRNDRRLSKCEQIETVTISEDESIADEICSLDLTASTESDVSPPKAIKCEEPRKKKDKLCKCTCK